MGKTDLFLVLLAGCSSPATVVVYEPAPITSAEAGAVEAAEAAPTPALDAWLDASRAPDTAPAEAEPGSEAAPTPTSPQGCQAGGARYYCAADLAQPGIIVTWTSSFGGECECGGSTGGPSCGPGQPIEGCSSSGCSVGLANGQQLSGTCF